jgi:hypothetical protein
LVHDGFYIAVIVVGIDFSRDFWSLVISGFEFSRPFSFVLISNVIVLISANRSRQNLHGGALENDIGNPVSRSPI